MSEQNTDAYAEWLDEGTTRENLFLKYLTEGIDFLSETIMGLFTLKAV